MMLSASAALASSLLFPAAMVYAGLMDLTTMRIPNKLIVLIIIGFAVLAPLVGIGLSDMGLNVAVALAVLLCSFALFAFGWIGGGDAKLVAATSLWMGSDFALSYLVYTAICGGVLTLLLLQFRAAALPVWMLSRPWIARLHAPQSGVPYGIAMAVAAMIVFPSTPWAVALF